MLVTTRATEQDSISARFELELVLLDMSHLGYSPDMHRPTFVDCIRDKTFSRFSVLYEHEGVRNKLRDLGAMASELNLLPDSVRGSVPARVELRGEWLTTDPSLPGRYMNNGSETGSLCAEKYLWFAILETLEWERVKSIAEPEVFALCSSSMS
jgi:hypothetical protein